MPGGEKMQNIKKMKTKNVLYILCVYLAIYNLASVCIVV